MADLSCCLNKLGLSAGQEGVLAMPKAQAASPAVGLRVWIQLGFCSLWCSCWHSSRAAPSLLMSKLAEPCPDILGLPEAPWLCSFQKTILQVPPRPRGMFSQPHCPLQPERCFPPSQIVIEAAPRSALPQSLAPEAAAPLQPSTGGHPPPQRR